MLFRIERKEGTPLFVEAAKFKLEDDRWNFYDKPPGESANLMVGTIGTVDVLAVLRHGEAPKS